MNNVPPPPHLLFDDIVCNVLVRQNTGHDCLKPSTNGATRVHPRDELIRLRWRWGVYCIWQTSRHLIVQKCIPSFTCRQIGIKSIKNSHPNSEPLHPILAVSPPRVSGQPKVKHCLCLRIQKRLERGGEGGLREKWACRPYSVYYGKKGCYTIRTFYSPLLCFMSVLQVYLMRRQCTAKKYQPLLTSVHTISAFNCA